MSEHVHEPVYDTVCWKCGAPMNLPTPARDRPGLDVEVLAMALDAYWSKLGPIDPDMARRNREAADALVREYAAVQQREGAES